MAMKRVAARLNRPSKRHSAIKNNDSTLHLEEQSTVLSTFTKLDVSDDDDELELPQMFDEDETSLIDGGDSHSLKLKQSVNVPKTIPFLGSPSNGRTVSVALPASIVANAQARIELYTGIND